MAFHLDKPARCACKPAAVAPLQAVAVDAGIDEDDLRSEERVGYCHLRPASSSMAAVLAMTCGQRPIPG
ncbi:hypothetical protein [Diaphorobacter sp.]|uniref:hypothetical protein n=1 Tax=Diaphorobacter sp. TaxID=1934310 RepID=UPI00258C725A|nr:hypothetical protein [Diaphorobacter sp.]